MIMNFKPSSNTSKSLYTCPPLDTETTMAASKDGRWPYLDEKMLENQRVENTKDYYSHRSNLRLLVLCIVIVGTPYLFVHLLFPQLLHLPTLHCQDFVRTRTAHNPVRVPLEAHIMSKCPDTKACLKDLVVPAMEKVYEKVDFKLSYIGTYVVYHSILQTCLHL